jgi:glycosyltransferase involved in cell wall biosynthesis
MPRLLMATTRCYPELGGIESHVREVAARLAPSYDLEVTTTDRSGELARVEDVDGYRITRSRAWPRRRDYYLSPGLFWRVLRGDYDLLHVQGVHTLVPPLAMLAALLRRRPFVLTFHTGGSSSPLRARARGLQWRLLAPLLRRAAALVAVSEYEAEVFEGVLAMAPGTIQVIRNGGSLPAPAHPVRREPGLVLSTGRLERYKGHHRAIEALPHLIERHPDARLRILGSGPYEAELRALADRLGVADRVSISFVPPAEREVMARAVSAASVVTLLSDYEAHPVAVMEALTLERPVVVLRTSGLTELADLDWVVGLDPHASPAEVARAIEAQLDDPVLADPRDLPTWETCVAALSQLYDDVLVQHPQRAS